MAVKTVKQIITERGYEGILAQDGWETLELTVKTNHSHAVAKAIITEMEKKNG